LIDASAAEEERKAILGLALSTKGVRAVHRLRTRYIGPGLQVDLHVLVEPELNVREGHAIAGVVKECLLEEGANVRRAGACRTLCLATVATRFSRSIGLDK
jgi:divalent metal cation (Fe/Co/Zn/Cd) transporter